MNLSSWTLCVAFVLAGCGASSPLPPAQTQAPSASAATPSGSDTTATSAPAHSAEYMSLVTEFATAACENLRNCPDQQIPFLMMRPFLSGDASLCARAMIGSADSRIDEAIRAGRISIDSAQAAAFMEAVRTSCIRWVRDPLRPALVGHVAEGAQCEMDSECAAGQCAFDQDTCPGTCRASSAQGAVALGAQCESSDDCAPDAQGGVVGCFLNQRARQMQCLLEIRTSDVARGEPCGELAARDHITRASCGAGLYCRTRNLATDVNGVCSPAIAVGARCRIGAFGMGDSCEAGAICDGSGDAGVCRRIEWIATGNESCASAATGNVRLCNPYAGLECVNDVCSPVNTPEHPRCYAEVSSHGFTLEGSSCDDASYCVASEGPDVGTCKPRASNGAACTSNAMCESHHCSESQRCAPREPRCG